MNNAPIGVFDSGHGELDVHQTDDMQCFRQFAGSRMNLRQNGFGQITRWNGTSGIARMDARLFDVLHDGADNCVVAI